jgi:transposase
VSISSVVRFLRRHRETGSVKASKFGGYKPFSVTPYEKQVRRLVAEQPDITLTELQARLAKEKVSIAPSSVFRFLRHVGLTFKKSLHAAEQDWPDVAAARSALPAAANSACS